MPNSLIRMRDDLPADAVISRDLLEELVAAQNGANSYDIDHAIGSIVRAVVRLELDQLRNR